MRWRATRARELLSMARQDPVSDSTDPMGLLRRVSLLADAEGDDATSVEARDDILSEATWVGARVDQVVAFAWLLGRSRKDSEMVDLGSLMWRYKWVVESLIGMVSVRAEIVDQIIDDLEKDYLAQGLATSAAHQLRVGAAIVMKRRTELPGVFDTWSRNESGAGSDCAACRRHARIEYLTAIHEDERAVTEAGPILKGEMSCAEIPRVTFPVVVESYLRLGNLEEAKRQCRRGIEALDSDRMGDGLGVFLVCLARTGQLEAAFKLFSTSLRAALLSWDNDRRFQFFRGASFLMRAARATEDSVYLVLPPMLEILQPDGLYEIDELRAYFDARADQLAERFDRRHGNNGYREELQTDRESLKPGLE